jgi:hypothetical protein
MTWQSSDKDLARAQSCLVSPSALPLDMYAPQEHFLCTTLGLDDGGAFLIFRHPLKSPCNGIHCPFFFG